MVRATKQCPCAHVYTHTPIVSLAPLPPFPDSLSPAGRLKVCVRAAAHECPVHSAGLSAREEQAREPVGNAQPLPHSLSTVQPHRTNGSTQYHQL